MSKCVPVHVDAGVHPRARGERIGEVRGEASLLVRLAMPDSVSGLESNAGQD